MNILLLFYSTMAFPFIDRDPSTQLVVTSLTNGFGGADAEDLVEEVVIVMDDPPWSVEP